MSGAGARAAGGVDVLAIVACCGKIYLVETESGFFVSSPETRKPNILGEVSPLITTGRNPANRLDNGVIGGLIAVKGGGK